MSESTTDIRIVPSLKGQDVLTEILRDGAPRFRTVIPSQCRPFAVEADVSHSTDGYSHTAPRPTVAVPSRYQTLPASLAPPSRNRPRQPRHTASPRRTTTDLVSAMRGVSLPRISINTPPRLIIY
jgi:hypothetical protein